MSRGDNRPDRHALLELDALLGEVEKVAHEGNRRRYDTDDRYRWVLHRLWIAVGNEALAYARLLGLHPQRSRPWAGLYQLRNSLAHVRLPDIDEDYVWRVTVMRPGSLRAHVREHLC